MPSRPRSRRGLATWLTSTSTPLFVVNERRVVLVDQHLGDDRHHVTLDVALPELVQEGLLEDVAEASFRHRDQDVERHGGVSDDTTAPDHVLSS